MLTALAQRFSNTLVDNSIAKVEKAKVEQLYTHRRQQAQEDYQLGIEKLEVAKESHFKHPQLVQEAYLLFNRALRQDTKNPDYKTQIAYILVLIQDYSAAKNALQEVLELAPNHIQALALQNSLQALQNRKQQDKRGDTWEAFRLLPKPARDRDFDQLYYATEIFIQNEAHQVLNSPLSSLPTLESEMAEDQAQMLSLLQHLVLLIEEKLELLEVEFDIHSLQNLCRPLYTSLQKFQRCVETNLHLFNSQEDLNLAHDTLAEIMTLLEDVPTGTELDLSEPLEQIFDLCDQLADDLDKLGEEPAVASLIESYEALLNTVNRLQEGLDA